MPIAIDQLEAEVLSLSPADRAHLLERLIESFEPESKTQDAWVAVALHRQAGVLAGTVALVPGSDAVARVRARIS